MTGRYRDPVLDSHHCPRDHARHPDLEHDHITINLLRDEIMKSIDAQPDSLLFRFLTFLWLPAFLVLAVPASGQPDKLGEWEPKFDLPNIAIHMHVLPTGKVLFWSRREWRDNQPAEGLDPHDCTPRILDPDTRAVTETAKPGFNLFCSGHTFLADGRLFVVGGHIADAQGEDKTAIYDPFANTWTRSE